MQKLSPARAEALIGGIASLLLAVAPAVGNLDTSSTHGVEAGILAIGAIVVTRLQGWQKHEDRAAQPSVA